jgi:5-methylthioadenosine/S-adenosylhomocysteine deaminase
MVRALHSFALDHDTTLFMHMNDSQEERDEARRRYGHGTIVELDRWGCLEARSLYAHCTWLDSEEIDLLREREIGVSHDPVANASYACGLAPLPDLLAAGVRVGLGVDGASTNNSQNLWETAKAAIFLQKNTLGDAGFGSAELALELLTIGGARALHMEDRIGSLEPGKHADVIVVDLDRPSLLPRPTALSSLVYSSDPRAVRSVFVGGVERVRDGEHLTLDRGEVVETAQREGERKLVASGLAQVIEDRMASRWRWAAT